MLLQPDAPLLSDDAAATDMTTSDHLTALAARGTQRTYRRGTLLIQEGDRGDQSFVILSGKLRAFAAGEQGKEITLGLYGPGDYVGEMSLDGGTRSASVEATETTECAVITRATLLGFIRERPEFAMDMMARIIRRARMATESARALALVDIYGRLRHLFNQLADAPAADGSRTIPDRLTHQQIASHLACSREMVSKLMKDLEAGGYVEVKERRIVLVKGLPARW